MGLYDKIFKPKKLVLANGKVVEEKCSRAPLIIILIVIATWISVKVTGFSMTTLVTRIRFFFDILAQMFPPKVGYISSIWGPLFDTIKMSLLGSFVGGVLAIPFAILASSNLIKNKVVIGVVRVIFKYRAYDSDAGCSPDRNLYLGTWHHGRYLCNRSIYFCLCRKTVIRDDRDGRHGSL